MSYEILRMAPAFTCPTPIRRPATPGAFDPPCDAFSTNVSVTLGSDSLHLSDAGGTMDIVYSGNHVSVSNTMNQLVGGNGRSVFWFSTVGGITVPVVTVPTGYGVCASVIATATQTGYISFPTFNFQAGFRDHTGGGAGTSPGNLIHASTPHAITAPNVAQPATWGVQGLAPPASTTQWDFVTVFSTVLSSPDPATTFTFEGDVFVKMFVCDQNFSHPQDILQQTYSLPSPLDTTSAGWQINSFCNAKVERVSDGFNFTFAPTGDCYMILQLADAAALHSVVGCQTPRLDYEYSVVGDFTGADIESRMISLNQNTGEYGFHQEIPTASTGVVDATQIMGYHPWSNRPFRNFVPVLIAGFSAAAPSASVRAISIRNLELKGWTTL
jgi:hypothetical protein